MKLSAPYFSKMSSRIALEPLPEKGLTTMRGINSDGIPSFLPTAEREVAIKSERPLLLIILTPTISIIRVGSRLTVSFIPLFAPDVKSDRWSFLENRSITERITMRNGIIREESFSVMSYTFFRRKMIEPLLPSSKEVLQTGQMPN